METNVLLFSGGVDSYVAYYYLQKQMGLSNIVPVYFDLGAPYNAREMRYVKKLLPETVIDKSINIGNMQRGENAFIPYRNLILACLASKYGGKIWIAGLKDDCVEDKNPMAFNCMNDCMNFITKPEDFVKLDSPFWNMTKSEVVAWWNNNIGSKTIMDTISCYDQFDRTNYCGRCPSCFRRFVALKTNGWNIDFYNQKLFDEYMERAGKRKYDQKRCEDILSLEGYQCKKIYSVDIDGILTVDTEGHDYSSRSPHRENIAKIVRLWEQGNRIDLFTSRYGTPDDRKQTEEWLEIQKVPYTCIQYGKPYFDVNFDDKNQDIKEV